MVNWLAGVGFVLHVLAAEPAPAAADPGQGPLLALGLAALALVGTVATALAPSLLEFVKGKSAKAPEAPSPTTAETPPAVSSSDQLIQSGSAGLSMVEQMMADYRGQRDNFQKRYDDVLNDLEEAREIIREQAVYIAKLEGAPRRHVPNYGGPYGSPTPDRPRGTP